MLNVILPIAVVALLLLSAMLAASETALFALVRMEDTREKLRLGRLGAAMIGVGSVMAFQIDTRPRGIALP